MAKRIEFNPYQAAVVNFRTGYAVAMAAPGSGKTAVVTARVRALLAEGVSPKDILSLTFTSEGAKEMTERAGLKEVEEKIFSTFHSWALAFVKKEWRALPFKVKTDWHGIPSVLCLPQEAARTLGQICRRLPEVKWRDAQSFISLMKRRGITPSMAHMEAENEREEIMAVAYEKYERALRDKGVLDFDSIVIETANMLERRADVRERNQFRFVQVDEAQDTDSIQWRVIKAITEKHRSALAVGDENQGMYSWRGSESNLTQYFTNLFPGSKVFPLPINYRSTQAIVEYCKTIAPIQNETVTKLQTPNEKGVAPSFMVFPLEKDEATQVINTCGEPGETAVLARTNRQLAIFENECSDRGIRYKLLGKSGFWGQREVKDVLSIVGSVVFPTDANILRMLTAKCELTKFIRKSGSHEHASTPDILKRAAERHPKENGKPYPMNRLLTQTDFGDQSQTEAVKNIGFILHGLRGEVSRLNGEIGMKRVLERFGVFSAYDELEDDEKNFDNDPTENIQKLVEYATKKPSLKDFFEWTQKVDRARRARTNCLTLSTIHQSKGKEWPNVFVIGVNLDVLPHVKGDLEEEKRIFFVACSRAAKRLQVSANGITSPLIEDRVEKGEAGKTIDVWEGYQLAVTG